MSRLRLYLDWGLVIGALCSFLTPLNQLLAFSSWLSDRMPGRGFWSGEWPAMLLFCLLNFVYIVWLHRRAKTRGEMADGPVGPGTGTVE